MNIKFSRHPRLFSLMKNKPKHQVYRYMLMQQSIR
jgi:hypothetical protein